MQRQKVEAFGKREGKQWPADGRKRRRLIVVAVVSPRDPFEPRNLQSRAQARIRGILIQLPRVVRHAQTGVERDPSPGFVLLVEERRGDVSGRLNVLAGDERTRARLLQPEQAVITLMESVKP